MKKNTIIFRFVLIILLLAFLLTAILQNLNKATVQFLFLWVQAPVIAVILVSLFIGYILGILSYSIISLKSKKKEQQNPTAENKKKTKA